MSAMAADSDADGYPDSLESYHNTNPSDAVSHPSPIYENVEVYLSADLADQADRPGEDGAVLKDLADGNDFSFSGSSLVPGLFGEGLVCSGSRLHAGDVVDTGADSLTVSFWFKADDVQPLQFLACKGNRHSGADGWAMFIYDGKLRLRANHGVDGVARLTIDKAGIVAGQWHHVVMVLDQDLGKIVGYLDGVSSEDEDGGWVTDPTRTDTFASGVTFDNSGSLTIGSRDDGGFGFSGMVDDVAIARRGWSEDQVEMVFDAGLRGLSFGSLQDSDNDGLFDAWEVLQFGDLLQTAQGDFDGDGLGNGWEYENRIDASNPDVDADGFSDGLEVFAGSDWDDAADLPDEIFTGIVSYHPFDADTVVEGESLDLAGGNHANLLGERPGTTAGLFGDSLSFVNAGGDECAEFFQDGQVGGNLDPGSGSYTVSFWFKADSVRHRVQFIASKGNIGSTSDGWSVWLHYDGIFVRGNYGHDGGARLTLRHDGIQAGQWNHVALVINQQTGRWEASLNGSHSSNAASAWSVPSGRTDRFSPGVNFVSPSPLLIGLADNMGSEFQGQVDDFVIARRAYSPGELADLHTAGRLGINFSQMADADGDGMPDAFEYKYLGGDQLPTEDADGDGLTNIEEYTYGTRPDEIDTDGDSIDDFQEIQHGTNPNDANDAPAPYAVAGVQGYLTHETWNGISGSTVEDLVRSSKFLSTPDKVELTVEGAGFEDSTDNYGSRMRGTIRATVSGDYTFWVSGDNNVELWLSGNDEKFGKQRIAWLADDAWQYGEHTNFQSWDKYITQRSATIYLEAGQQYYIESLTKQSSGGGHTWLAWQAPGGEREPIPSSALYTYSPDINDIDDDFLPDTWETTNGLSASDNGFTDSREGEYGDYDSDGLTNREEYLLGTDPTDTDTDGDGVSDYQEANSFGSDPLNADNAPAVLLRDLDLTRFTDSNGDWLEADGEMRLVQRRGWLEYNFTVPAGGVYIYEVAARAVGVIESQESLPLEISIDGVSLGRVDLLSENGLVGTVEGLTPNLSAGAHTLKVRLANMQARRSMTVEGIKILTPAGIDADTNGQPDWIDVVVDDANMVTVAPEFSRTSPVCIEGKTRRFEGLSITEGGNALSVLRGVDTGYYLDVALPADGSAITVASSFEGGLKTEIHDIEWQTTNIISGETLTIRKGDALRLGAWNDGSLINDSVTINVNGTLAHNTNVGAAVAHSFDTAGTFTVDAVLGGADPGTGTLTVEVVEADFGNDLAVSNGQFRTWELPGVGANVTLEPGSRVSLLEEDATSGGDRVVSVKLLDPETCYVLARTEPGGAILARGVLNGFDVAGSMESGEVRILADYTDGRRLMAISYVYEGALPAGFKMKLSTYASGLAFLDGSTTKWVTADDFDDSGVAVVYFEKESGYSNGAVCHWMGVMDGDDPIN